MKYLTIVMGICCVLASPRGARSASPQEASGTVLPYLAVGGVRSGVHFETRIWIHNPTDAAVGGVIDIFDEQIQPLPISVNGDRGLAAEFAWRVPAGGLAQFQLDHPSESVQSGWMRVLPAADQNVDMFVELRVYDGPALVSQDGILIPSKKDAESSISLASLRGRTIGPRPYRFAPLQQ